MIPGRVLDAARRLGGSTLALLHTRLELFGLELKEELGHVVLRMAAAAAGVALALVGVAFAGWALVMSFAPEERPLAAAAFAAACLGAAAVAVWAVRRLPARRPFDASLRALERDRRALTGR